MDIMEIDLSKGYNAFHDAESPTGDPAEKQNSQEFR
jgi:hypothetical protein